MPLNWLLTLTFGIIQMILNSNVYKKHQDYLPYSILFLQLFIWIVYGFFLFPIDNQLFLLLYISICILTLVFSLAKQVFNCCSSLLGTIQWSIIFLLILFNDTKRYFIVNKLLNEDFFETFTINGLIFIFLIFLISFIFIPMSFTLYTIYNLKRTGLGKIDITLTMGFLAFLGLIISDLILSRFFELNSALF